MKETGKFTFLPLALLFCLLSIFRVATVVSAEETSAEWLQASLRTLAGDSSQVLVVVGEDSSGFTAKLHALEKRGGRWCSAFPPLPALIGRNGFAPPGEKKEGDVRTPSGVFALKRAFGYAAAIDTRLSYRQAGDDDLWVDDSNSPDYNRWVRKGETSATSFEQMKLNDDRYKYGIVIEYNTDPVVKGAGSAIFIHVRRGENLPTMGCVALAENDILRVLSWLDPKAKPRAILGTKDELTSLALTRQTGPGKLPKGFVYLDESIPDVRLDVRYSGSHNFVGKPVDGYRKQRCILTREAAEALRKVQEELRPFGLGLKVFDGYRPQMAVDHFVRWARDLDDARMKREFYPEVKKEDLFRDGYVAAKSGHSRGSSVDLTIVSLGREIPDRELDMGSSFDFFGLRSWPDSPQIAAPSRAHRLLLRSVMEKHGFRPYAREWWHFTLKNEPWPETYFNFPVQ